MKLVLLEALIVLIATQAVLSLMGHAPPWPAPTWEFIAGFALLSAVSLGLQAAGRRKPKPAPLAPPRIPLDQIVPFRLEAMPVRFGARDGHDIHLN